MPSQHKNTFFSALEVITQDLARHLSAEERYHRLLHAWRTSFPCDACALLKLQDNVLIPLAADGFEDRITGRQFPLDQHPRLAQILQHRESLRFDANSDLPDPYDGLISTPDGELHVHDCMGAVVQIDDKPWGMVTMDALNPHAFDDIDPFELHSLLGLTAATLKTAALIDALEHKASYQQQVTAALVEEQQHQNMLGTSKAMLALKKDIELVAQSELTALILGESGVGKELVARAIHQQSTRAGQAIVTVNCAALPESLVESELFGHVSGAFSGANKDRLGKFELANGGTLFLDEVGELPLSVQASLLRVLQSGDIQRLGSDNHHQVDVRIIAATNRDLKNEVSEGRFRADLYHRLSVYPLHVAPLRERINDVVLLAGHFLARLQRQLGSNNLTLAPEAEAAMLSYNWPGNVRELEHLLSRAALKGIGREGRSNRVIVLQTDDLDLSAPGSSAPLPTNNPQQGGAATIDTHSSATAEPMQTMDLKSATDHFQRQYIQYQLDLHQGKKAPAARALGLDRSNLQRLLNRLGL
jgi:anaerobic nitric oxide reductase transcription regulator